MCERTEREKLPSPQVERHLQGREPECFRGTTLFHRPLAGRGLSAAAGPGGLRTAGRCNGRTRRRLVALASRLRSSETIFSPLFPACSHLPGSLVEVNARAYSSLHSRFCDIVFYCSPPAPVCQGLFFCWGRGRPSTSEMPMARAAAILTVSAAEAAIWTLSFWMK